MTKRVPAAAAAILLFAAALAAVAPQKWTFRTADDFLRGKFDGVSVSSEGVLTLGPREEKLQGPSEDFYLSFLMTPDGVAYLGTGHEGRIYKISKDGKAELFCQIPEMDVSCLAVDRKGVLYAGTSPNGKVYRVKAEGKAEAKPSATSRPNGSCSTTGGTIPSSPTSTRPIFAPRSQMPPSKKRFRAGRGPAWPSTFGRGSRETAESWPE